MINNQERFNELKWKFFWEQKRKEVWSVIEILLFFISGMVLVGLIILLGYGIRFGFKYLLNFFNNFPSLYYWIFGSIIGTGLLFLLLFLWLNSNMNRAKKRAREVMARA